MNISYNWLKELIDVDLLPNELAVKLTGVGLAVEAVHEVAGDFVFDIDLTSNRPDCLSHLGISREIAAFQNAKLKIKNSELKENPQSATRNLTSDELVTIEDAELCQRFTARIIRNVKIAPSPEWLVKRLEAVGERSINNVADITNFVMHELGQPMHSFDLNKLAENRIVVRRARNGESIKTLDDVERQLDDSMLVICDAEKPAAIAGIMGGQASSITAETTDVLLEVANFKRENIRQTSRRLKLSTEAGHRFERGTDIENLLRASQRATDLIGQLASGIAGEFIDVYPTKFVAKEIESKDIQVVVKQLTGLETGEKEILLILESLGIREKEQSKIQNPKSKIFVSPSWRHDLSIEEDLVEEVARIIGYDKIGEELPPSFSAGEYQPTEKQKKNLRQALTTNGFNEAISYSFINSAQDEKFEFVPDLLDETATEKFITLQDSIIEGAVRMRATLLYGLLESVRKNFNFGNKNLKLFEIGKVFAAQNPDSAEHLPKEKELFALILTGGEIQEGKAAATRELDFYDAKGTLETAIEAMNLPKLNFRAGKIKHLREGNAADILLNGQKIGTIGRLNDEIAASYKFKQTVFVAEIDLQLLLENPPVAIVYQPLNNFPSVVRDVSLLVKRRLSFADLQEAIKLQKVEFCEKVEFVDLYEGKGIAADERSITIRFEFRAANETLREEAVEEKTAAILGNLIEKFGVKQRF